MTPTIALAIPCYNGEVYLETTLAAVAALDPPPEQLLVVDDGSRDSTAAVARSWGATILRHGRNRGLSAARNTALDACSQDVLAFVDADASPCRSLMARWRRLFGRGAQVATGQGVEAGGGSLANRWRSHFWRQTHGATPLDDVPFVMGLCCAFRRDVLREVGGFSEALRTHGEDLDLSYRLRRRGYPIAYDPLALVIHRRRDSLASLLTMIRLHSQHHVAVNRAHGVPWRPVMSALLRWSAVSTGSSLLRHRDVSMALLSPWATAVGLLGAWEGLRLDVGSEAPPQTDKRAC